MDKEEIKVDKKKLEKQIFEEIRDQKGAVDIRIAVPKVTEEKLDAGQDLGIYSYVHCDETSPVTVAMTAMILDQTKGELLKDPIVSLAYECLKSMGHVGKPTVYGYKKRRRK